MNTYTAVIHDYGTNLKVFAPVAKAVNASLKRLGRHDANGRWIIFGAHSLPFDLKGLPDSAVIYNLEIIDSGSPLVHQIYLDRMKQHEVWDSSLSNIALLREHGIEAKHVPIGYSDTYLFDMAVPTDIDVLFYGSMSDRRNVVIDQLVRRGLNVVTLFGVFGEELQSYIRRSRLVLDVGYYVTSHPVNQVKLAPLWSNNASVLSETPTADGEGFAEFMVHCGYENLVDEAVYLLRNTDKRIDVSDRAHWRFLDRSQTRYLDAVLE